MNGILLVDKPEGLSSAAVVRLIKKAFTADKIGHLGTLDPFASGLLPLCVGTGTKVAQFLMAERKAYTGTIRLGVETDTLDGTGTVVRTMPVPRYGQEVLHDLAQRFTGAYQQIPPMYSALKRQGVPLYKLARRGVTVEREPRTVQVESFSLTSLASDVLGFSLSCSKGTYVRVLAEDIGVILGCGAYLETLCRTEFGEFFLTDALPLQLLLEQQKGELPILSPTQAMRHYRAFRLPSDEMVNKLRQGQQDILRSLPTATKPQEIVTLVDQNDELVAVIENQQNHWRLVRVL